MGCPSPRSTPVPVSPPWTPQCMPPMMAHAGSKRATNGSRHLGSAHAGGVQAAGAVHLTVSFD